MIVYAKAAISVAALSIAGFGLAACGQVTARQAAPVVTKTVHVTVPAKTTIARVPAQPASPVPRQQPTQAARSPAAPAPVAQTPGFTNASAVISQFYQDITDGNYTAAWSLGGDNIGGTDYTDWAAGYSTTASITIATSSTFGSGQVQADLIATQTDGSVKTYTGTYTVSGGAIVAANIIQTS